MMFTQAESLRSSLHKLEGLLKEYSPLMSESTERVVDTAINYGAAVAGVSPIISKPAGRSHLLVESNGGGCLRSCQSHV